MNTETPKSTVYHTQGFYNRKTDEYVCVLVEGNTGVKRKHVIKRPKVPVYVIDPNKAPVPTYHREFMKREEVNEYYVYEKNREAHIANLLGIDDFWEKVKEKKMRRTDVYLDRRLFLADLRVEDVMMYKIMNQFGDRYQIPRKLIVNGIDIETNVKDSPNDQSKQPIYMIGSKSSYLTSNTNYVDYLTDSRFKYQDKLRADFRSFGETVRTNLLKEMDGSKKIQKFSKSLKDTLYNLVRDMKFVIREHADERELIKSAWQQQMTHENPDYLIAYNTDYDASHTFIRCEELGLDPTEVFCNPSFGGEPYVNIVSDMMKKRMGRVPEREKHKIFHPKILMNDYSFSSFVKLTDLMTLHYGMNPGETAPNYGLDYLSESILGLGKKNYKHVADDIYSLPYEDFVLATEYNIIDNILLEFINIVTQDVNNNLIKRMITYTEFDKLNKSSPYVTSAVQLRCKDMVNVVMSNNINVLLDQMTLKEVTEFDARTYRDGKVIALWRAIKTERKISGGHVANPNRFHQIAEEIILGVINRYIHGYTIDADYEAHYPSGYNDRNIGKESLIGKLSIDLKKAIEANLKKILNPTQISQKLINRCPVGLGEVAGLPSLHELVEMTTGVKTRYTVKEEEPYKVYKIRKEADKLRTILGNLVNIKRTDIDEQSWDYSLTSYCKLGKGEMRFLSANTLLSYKMIDKHGVECDIAEILLGHSFKKPKFGKIIKDEFQINNNPDLELYVTPVKNVDHKKIVHTRKMTEEEVDEINTAKRTTYKLILDRNDDIYIDVHKRVFSGPINTQMDIELSTIPSPEHKGLNGSIRSFRYVVTFYSSINIIIEKEPYNFLIKEENVLL